MEKQHFVDQDQIRELRELVAHLENQLTTYQTQSKQSVISTQTKFTFMDRVDVAKAQDPRQISGKNIPEHHLKLALSL